jgi:hypothetical protein
MAERVARVRILAQIEGLEGFDKLKGAFKGLEQSIGPSDAALAKARKEILEFGKAGKTSEQVIRGQIDALKALQGQASISGTVYQTLGKDVKALGSAYKEAATGIKQFTDAQKSTQFVGAKAATFDPQIAALRRQLSELSVYEKAYTSKLTEIQRRQQPFGAAVGRQRVIADFEAYAQGPLGPGSSGTKTVTPKLPDLPDTTAGLNQRMTELAQELLNVSRGGEDWIRVSREIVKVQRQLNQEFANPAVEAARRRLEQSRNVSSGFLQFSTGLEDRLAIQKSIDRNRRRQEAEAAARSGPMQGPPAPSELFRGIAGIGNQTAANQAERMGRSYQEVAESIRTAARASDGSINSLRSQRTAWDALRNSVNATEKDFRQATRELQILDRQLKKTETGGLRGKIGYIGQGVGAIASAGIFGGPEGALGGALGGGIGALMGGPAGFAAGSFIGSSIGAYAGMFRQSMTAAGEFAAEVKRLEIALKGVAGSASEYAKAQQVIALAGAELNVPVLEATQGFTQLTAAVKGAGGGVNEAEVVFRGVTEAIKATGGGAEQVQGALTAMAQIFSKGKVSAEELQGQLGERLPGAVTMFAQATGRTLPQLQKDLEQGVVGLNDVIKFAVSLSDKYGEQSAKMAASTEDSTARMKVAMDELKLTFGAVVKPITASIQSIIIKIADMATRALRSFGFVRDGLAELGAVDRAKDLQARASDAYGALGAGYQSLSEKKEALRRAQALAAAATPQKSFAGIQQNLRALQQAQDVINKISADGLDKRRQDILLNVSTQLTTRITAEQKLLDELKKKRDFIQFEDPANKKGDLDRKALEKAEREAAEVAQRQQQLDESLAQRQQQLDESLAKARIAMDDAVFQHQIELIRKKYEYEQQLQNKQRENWIKEQTGAARATASLVAGFVGDLQQMLDGVVQANEAIVNAEQKVKSTQAMAAVTVSEMVAGTTGGSGGLIGYTGGGQSGPSRGRSTGAHLHGQLVEAVRGATLEAMIDAALDFGGGRTASSFGLGRGASAHGYPGRDFYTPQSTPFTLRPGWTGVDMGIKGALGRGMQVSGPLGKFELGHLAGIASGGQSNAVAPNGIGAAGAAAAQRRDVSAESAVDIAKADLQQQKDLLKLYQEQLSKMTPEMVKGFTLDITDELRQQNAALKDNAEIVALRNKLEMEGARPEIIESEVKKAEATLRTKQSTEVLTKLLASAQAGLNDLKAQGKGETPQAAAAQAQVDAYSGAILNLNNNLVENVRLTNEATAAQIALNDAMRFRQDNRIGLGLKDGAQQYVESIGTMREATAQLAQTGIKGVEDAIFSLVTTGTANFQEFAASILKDTARMIIQQLVLRTLMQAIGAIGGGSAGGAMSGAEAIGAAIFNANGNVYTNGIRPFAMGGIVTKPTLFKFANGGAMSTGLMGEAGPEAIVPLRRGRDGRLGVAAGGGSAPVINISVDASGTQVQGNGGQGEALGRAVSQAVQAELIKQRRPGGLLAA